MKKLKNAAMSLLMAGVLAFCCTFNVNAAAMIETYYSPQMSTGEWWSGYDDGAIITINTGISGDVSGEDVDLVFRKAGIGFPNQLYRSSSRGINVQLKENDILNDNELAGKYYTEFEINPYTGFYQPEEYERMFTGGTIETNSKVELYVRIFIDIHAADVYKVIPELMVSYYFVVNE